MENTIVLFKSSTGFTRKYAEWIAEDLKCKVLPINKVNVRELNNYKTIIFGGGVHARFITGLKSFKKVISYLKDKNIILFATGAAPAEATDLDSMKKVNFPSEDDDALKLFYFQGGINYEAMSFGSKLMMKLFTAILKGKKDKTPEEEGMYETISSSHDYSNKEYIKPLIEFIKQ